MDNNHQDLSIEYLKRINWMSAKAMNACLNNRLNGLNDIILFYRKNGNFKRLSNCELSTKRELNEICKRLNHHSIDTIIEEIIELERINNHISEFNANELNAANLHIRYLINKLSVRGRNGLMSLFNGVPKIHELSKIYTNSFSFRTIRNIGDKTILELQSFKEESLIFIKKCTLQENQISDSNIKPIIFTEFKESVKEIVKDFNPFKKAALNCHIEYLLLNLGVRGKNGLIKFFGNSFGGKEVIEKIYLNSFDFRDIRNIGSKTVSELENFKENLFSFIKTLQFIEDDQLSREYAKLIIKTTFSNLPINFNEQFENVFDSTGKIRLFKLILFLVENGQLLKQKERELFYFLYTENTTQPFDQIAKALDLTKERLRQIKVILEDEIQNYFRFILSFNSQDIIDYDIVSTNYFKVIDNFFIQKINTAEDVKFNVRFYGIIFGLLFEKSHSVLGDDETLSGRGNYSNVIHYKNCYILDNSIFNLFDFEKFTSDVSNNLSERITETYALHFEGYLLQFIKQGGKQYLLSIKETCEAILYNEFGLVIDNEGYIVFEKNVKKLMLDYVLEILEELGEMTKIEIITKAINAKNPELAINEQSIRSTLNREKELFIYIGRTSTYGLAKWQGERVDLKGGTIRNLTEEYLQKYTEPKHIADIASYILQFRPNTYERSVLDNLKAEKSGMFIFMGRGLVGLKTLTYSSDFFGFKRVTKDWNEKYQELKEFRKQNTKTWPSILSQKKTERALYNFLYKNRVSYYNNSLDNEKRNLLKEIGFLQYLESSRATDWHTEFDKLKSFIVANNKLPSANSILKDERSLYRFLYLTKKKIINKELECEKIKLFNEIIR